MPETKLRVAPKPRRQKVDSVHIAVSENAVGEEIYTIDGPSGEKLPLVAIDEAGVAVLTSYAQDAANESGKVITIVRFTRRDLHATVRPSSTGD